MIGSRLLFGALITLSAHLHGWWDTGHMLIVEIAKTRMSAEAIYRAEELVQCFATDFPESNTLLTAACFPDDITSLGLCGFKVWHGVLTPYDPERLLSENEISIIHSLIEANSIVQAVNQSIETLCNPYACSWEKCFMLRFLLHTVGDLHQPLHCIQMYSTQFPDGDLAGHRYPLAGDYRNLHLLWDSILGIGSRRLMRPLTLEDTEWLEALAAEITQLYPANSFANLDCEDPEQWSTESYELAVQIAYQDIVPNAEPSNLYLERGRCCAKRQLALAGYRLGALLEQLFGPQGPANS